MRQHNNKGNNNRSRGRGGRKGPNTLTRSYESNGPDVKVRGTAQHIAEKYQTLARDSLSAGDGVSAEAYFQHAEHYNRIIMTAQAQQNAAREEQNAAREEERRNAAQAQPNNEQPVANPPAAEAGEEQQAAANGAGDEQSADGAQDGDKKERSSPRRSRGNRSRRSAGKADAVASADREEPAAKEQADTIMENPPAFLMSE